MYNGYWYDILAGSKDESGKAGNERLIFSYSASEMQTYGGRILDRMALAAARKFFSDSMKTKCIATLCAVATCGRDHMPLAAWMR